MKPSLRVLIALLVLAVALSACGGSTPTPTGTRTFISTRTPRPTSTPRPTRTSEPTRLPRPTSTPRDTSTPRPTETQKAVEAGASRSNPLPLGTEFTGETWSIVVSDVVRGQDAAQAVAKANQFNEPPGEGFEYLIADVKLKNISTEQEAQSASFAVDLRVTGDKNIVYGRASVVPPKSLEGELFPDGVTEGQLVFQIPSDEKNLMFIVGEMMSFDIEAMRFMAIDQDAKVVPDPSLRDIAPTDVGKRRDNPAKIGDTLVAGAWEFKVVEAVRGDKAAKMVKEANQFNEPAPEGQEYVLVKLKARYLGGDDPDQRENIDGSYLKITGEKNVVYEKPAIVPPEPKLDATLFAGGETEGWEVLSMSQDEKGLMVIFEPLFSFSSDNIRYISVEPAPTTESMTAAKSADIATPKPTTTLPPSDTPMPTATSTSAVPQVVAAKTVNLRLGPGTNYPVVGAAKAGERYAIGGRNQDGSWLEVCCVNGKSAWVSKSVVKVIGDANTIAVAKNIPPTPIPSPTSAPAPAATAVPAKKTGFGSGFPQIGQEVEAGGWRFKVTEAHKRKAVYLYDSSYIAQGHFLILVIEATNLHPGTSYFAHDVDTYVTDVPAKTYGESGKGSSYAQWMLGGADSLYTDVNPGVTVRMAVAYDLPDNLGDVLLSGGKALKWIYLGNFAQIKSEDS